jgi:hypothetical protein
VIQPSWDANYNLVVLIFVPIKLGCNLEAERRHVELGHRTDK